MLILDWMHADVIDVSQDDSLLQCRKLFKDHNIHRLPVVDANKCVVGMISASDINAFAPQHSTGLELMDALDLLIETPAKNVMRKNPVCVNYKGTLSQAALLMIEKHVPCMPVVEDAKKLVGILTEWDIFKALVNVTGAAMPDGVEMAFTLKNERGTLREILDQLKEFGVRISTVLSAIDDTGMRQVKLCFWSEDMAAERRALESLKNHAALRYWAHGGTIELRDKQGFKL